MIVTVTLNAALDRTLVAPGFTIGSSRTAEAGLNLAGGKGLNAARALHCLGLPVRALGFAGGLAGEQMRRALDAEGMPYLLVPIRRESRTCTAIVDPGTGSATEINEPGPRIEPDEQTAFLAAFDAALSDAWIVALSGSVPPGLSDDFYTTLIARAREKGVPCLLDTRNAPLREGVRAAPLFVKPNQHEAAELLGDTFDPQDRAFVERHMPQPGPALLCLTLGAEGAIVHAPAGSWRSRPPAVRVVDTVGAGDSFVGGIAAALFRAMGGSGAAGTALERAERAIARPDVVESMLRMATATATANTLSVGAGRVDPAEVERLLPLVALHRL